MLLNGKKEQNYFFLNGMIENKEKTHYYFYIIEKEDDQIWKDACVNCYSIEKDRFRCLNCHESEGFVDIKINPNYKYLWINFETFDNGYIQCQFINENEEIISESCKMKGNHINQLVYFSSLEYTNLYEYTLRFRLNKANLYSYKLTSKT